VSFKRFLIIAVNVCLASTVFAEDFSDFTPDWTKVITLSGGPAWTSPGRSQTYYIPPGISPFTRYVEYRARETTEMITSGEIFFALQKPVTPWLTERLGIAFAGATEADLQGTFAVNHVPLATYRYKISHGRAALKGLLAACPTFWAQPYISGSVGYSFNSSDAFKTNPPINVYNVYDGSLTLLKFNNTTKGSFVYTLGLGVKANLAKNWEVGIGYELADWGRSQLEKPAYLSWAFPPPKIANVYTHQLQFSLSYLYCL
jgi:hypothetical protein